MPIGPAMELDAMTQALLMTTARPRGVPRRVQREAQARMEGALTMTATTSSNVDDLLTDEDRAIRDTVRDFAQSELAPHIAEWYDEGTLPDGLGPMLGKLGLLGMHLEGYGCAGTSATAYGVACRELEAVDSGLRSLRQRAGLAGDVRASTAGAPRSRRRSGCRGWRPVTRSAASG